MKLQKERTKGNWTVEKEDKRMQPDGVSSFLKIVSDKPRYDMENGPTTYLICRFPMFSEANAEFVATAVNFHDRLVEQVKDLEWCDGANVTDGKGGICYVRACPSCSGAAHENFHHGLKKDQIGHRANCKLATLLDELKELEG